MISFTPRPFYLWGKNHGHPLDRRLGGPHISSGCRGEEKNSNHCTCVELNPGRPARSLVSILTKLSRLLWCHHTKAIAIALLEDFHNWAFTIFKWLHINPNHTTNRGSPLETPTVLVWVHVVSENISLENVTHHPSTNKTWLFKDRNYTLP
jgi:hypothetical protein